MARSAQMRVFTAALAALLVAFTQPGACFISDLLGALMGMPSSSASSQQPAANTAAVTADTRRAAAAVTAVQTQQATSVLTRELEDELVQLQQEVANVDRGTAAQRNEVMARLRTKKLQLLSSIARTAKILRVAYDVAHGAEAANLPIVVVPRAPTDAEADAAENVATAADGGGGGGADVLSPECASLAQEYDRFRREKSASSTNSEFARQAQSLATLPLNRRLDFDKEALLKWDKEVRVAKSIMQRDMAELGLVDSTAMDVAAEKQQTKTSKVVSAVKKAGSAALNLLGSALLPGVGRV